ncbi:MAG: J domain-containing protein [Candidatus Limnocylindria bacterium]
MTAPSTTGDDPYSILGVDRDADDATITTAHRALARRFHPDVAGDGATAKMVRINAAFDAIRTAERRARYDELDPVGGGVTTASAPGTSADGHPLDPARWRPAGDGTGKAGPPPGRPSGSVLDFGRHKGWSLGEIVRVDPGYLVWLEEKREGRPYLEEIDVLLRRTGHRSADGRGPGSRQTYGRGVFDRR